MNLIAPFRFQVRLAATLLLLAFGICPALQAQQRIATVDARQIFDGYLKTKEANIKLSNDAQNDTVVMNKLLADYRKLHEEWDNLAKAASDPALSPDEQKKRKASAEDKLKDLQEFEKSIKTTNDSFVQKADLMKRRFREEFLTDITNKIAEFAKAGTYDLVLDISGESGNNQTPMILFSSGKDDLTAKVLEALNKDVPKALLTNPASVDAPAARSTAPVASSTNNLPRSPGLTPTNSPARGTPPAAGSR